MAMALKSKAFEDCEGIPERFTCEGDNISPPLEWEGAPEGTRSFALVCDDPETPYGTFHHWAVCNIPPTVHKLHEGIPHEEDIGKLHQAVNDYGVTGYSGACPPKGQRPHHYHFRILALNVDALSVAPGASAKEIETIAEMHAIGQADLVGIYSRV